MDISPAAAQLERVSDLPLFEVEVDDPSCGLKGWLVVHSIGRRGCCGGVRLCPDVSRREVRLLARAMAYKYGFFEIALGGAKAGVSVPLDLTDDKRDVLLQEFGRRIGPLVKSKVYWPWSDMNCSGADVRKIYEGAGIGIDADWDSSAYFTSLSTFAALKAAADHYRIEPARCTVTIEGLGKVGRNLAVEIERWGGRLIGASTCKGAAVNCKGLDVREVVAACRRAGDDWVHEKGPWETVDKEQLFSLGMDIHVPCARVHSLTDRVAHSLNCRAVVPAANVPCTPDGEEKLMEKQIAIMPDFVVNGGGIVGPGLRNLGASDAAVRQLFLEDFGGMIQRLMQLSERTGRSASALAKAQSNAGLSALSAREVGQKKRNRKGIKILGKRINAPRKVEMRRRLQELRRLLDRRFS